MKPTLCLGVVGCVCWNLAAAPVSAADDSVQIEKVGYKGWKNNLRLTNGEVELVLTLDVGPRVIRYGFVGGRNVFKEYEEQMGRSGESEWQIRGGHRLWVAPEDAKRTYALDNRPVKYRTARLRIARSGRETDAVTTKVILTPSEEKPYGIQKQIDIALAPTGTNVRLVHRITNVGKRPTQLAPWALTVMAPGGTAIIPLPEKRPHPDALLPNQLMVLWPYFDFKDSRYSFGSKYITLEQDATRGPTKIGLAHKMGWVGYLNDSILFVKRFKHKEGKTYPDNGCNFETFTNQDMLEVESLGPLVTLASGETLEHVEHWELHKDVPPAVTETDIHQMIRGRLAK